MATDPIAAIKESRPPTTDYLTYLTIVESHLSPEILPTLQEILEDTELTQSIGWDLIQLLLPIPGSEGCLTTIARLGNPREVILKVTEALSLLDLSPETNESDDDIDEDAIDVANRVDGLKVSDNQEPTNIDKFCTLLSLLAILHPRIKTKYPSRFLSTSLIAVLSVYYPSHQATHAVTTFIHALSEEKRPMLPKRQSSVASVASLTLVRTTSGNVAPDPEATDEDPNEGAIKKKLLQSFATHVLEEYVKVNGLEWAARLKENFDPSKVIPNRKSWGDMYRDDPDLQERDICVGQLVVSEMFRRVVRTDC